MSDINWGDFLNDATPKVSGGDANYDVGTSVPAITGLSDSGPSGGGGWFDSLKNWWGSSPTKGSEGSGALGVLSDIGGFAKNILPVAGVGTGIMGLINQLQAQKQAGQARQDAKQATDVQLTGARGAQAMAPEIASVARRADPLAELAASVAPKIDAAATNVRTGIVSPVQEFAADRLRRAQAGEIPPAIEAQIQQWAQGARQRMRAYLAKSGQDDSSAHEQLESEIEAQIAAKRAEYLQSEEKQALAAFQQAQGGEVAAGGLFGSETAAAGAGAQILNAETAGLGRAADALTGSSQAAGGAAANLRAEEKSLLELIAQTNAALARLSAGAS